MTSNSASSDSRSSKKALVLNQQRSHKPLFLAILAVTVITAAGGLYFLTNPSAPHTPMNIPSSGAHGDATQIAYPLSLFGDGMARHFEHKTTDGLSIRYFILKSADGVVRAAFDACDVCWPANKGYSQEGDVMVCNNCGRRFDSIRINEVQGGCNPAPLKRTVQSDQLVLLVQDIEQGRAFFDFKAVKDAKGRG